MENKIMTVTKLFVHLHIKKAILLWQLFRKSKWGINGMLFK